MKLLAALAAYVQLKQSLGAVFATDRRILRSLGHHLGDLPVDALTPDACRAFCLGAGAVTRFAERKHQTLRGFFSYLTARGHLAVSPLSEPGPRAARTFQPYIYAHAEVRRLLDATAILATTRWPLRALTFRTLLLTLYGAGLRAGEALRLRDGDVDLDARVLAIWDTKFFKSRLVPIGTDLGTALATFRVQRAGLALTTGDATAFFPSRTGAALTLACLERTFVRLRVHAGIHRPASDRWQPRLHDLRHSFAVHRLIAWYRAGADVQVNLPLLATYLGHRNVTGTQPYLTMTPALLTAASQRFAGYAALAGEVAP
jgi:site-specific recombinase XerD